MTQSPTPEAFRALQDQVAILRDQVAELMRRANPLPIIHLTEEETQLPVVITDERAGRQILEALLSMAATADGMTRNDAKFCTHRRAAHVRQWVFLEAHQKGVSLPIIGRFFNRDHTTVLHGVRAERARRDARPEIAGEFRSRRAG